MNIKCLIYVFDKTIQGDLFGVIVQVDSCHPYLLPAWLQKQSLDLKLLQVHQDFNKKDRFMEFIKDA